MSETKAYRVYGETGEYADLREWTVKVYLRQEDAEAKAARAQKEANRIFHTPGAGFGVIETSPEDPGMMMDYTGTFYGVEEVDLELGT